MTVSVVKSLGRSVVCSILAGMCLALGGTANAATIVYNTPSTTPGDQNYADALGLDFTVNSAVTVRSLGAFDSGKDGITTALSVGLFNLTTSAFVTPLVNFIGTANPGGTAYVFKNIVPVLLTAGDNYSIVGYGFNVVDLNFNTNIAGDNGASPITFNSLFGRLTNGVSRYGGGLTPQNGTVFPFASAFGAGSLAAAAVPEPGIWAMLIVGFGMIGFAIRRRSATKGEAAYA